MTPYLRAWHAWHALGEPAIPWNELLTFFLHHGCVVNTPAAFILCRALPVGLADEEHNRLSPLQFTHEADCWNVWLAAGRLDSLLLLGAKRPLQWVSFSRRGESRIRRVKLATLIRHAQPENSQTAGPAATAAAGHHHRPREGRRRS